MTNKPALRVASVAYGVCLLVEIAYPVPGACAEGEANGERSRRLDLMRRAASRYTISSRNENGTRDELKLRRTPALRWSNPVRNTVDGAVFLWTHNGRPQVATCIYIYKETGIDHEFQSLARGPLHATYDGQAVWTPSAPGLDFASVPDADSPADAAAGRLIQMRRIVRRFQATLESRKNRRELRLLARPIYRYKTDADGIVDGAVFAFVQGTDPEVLLVLEARRNDGDTRWEYGFARMSSGSLKARYRGEVVWSVSAWDWEPDPNDPYITFVQRREK